MSRTKVSGYTLWMGVLGSLCLFFLSSCSSLEWINQSMHDVDPLAYLQGKDAYYWTIDQGALKKYAQWGILNRQWKPFIDQIDYIDGSIDPQTLEYRLLIKGNFNYLTTTSYLQDNAHLVGHSYQVGPQIYVSVLFHGWLLITEKPLENIQVNQQWAQEYQIWQNKQLERKSLQTWPKSLLNTPLILLNFRYLKIHDLSKQKIDWELYYPLNNLKQIVEKIPQMSSVGDLPMRFLHIKLFQKNLKGLPSKAATYQLMLYLESVNPSKAFALYFFMQTIKEQMSKNTKMREQAKHSPLMKMLLNMIQDSQITKANQGLSVQMRLTQQQYRFLLFFMSKKLMSFNTGLKR